MFCSECGKTIDDESLICPECGAITKNGLLKLQDAAKKGESVHDNVEFTKTESKDNVKTLKLVAMILGLAGSASLLSSLLGEFGSATVPIIGKYSVSIANYLDKMVFLVVLLAGLSIVASLLKYSILQTVIGAITGGWIAYMMCDLHSRASASEVSGWVDINFGLGTYLFILAACLMLASGIVYIVAEKKPKTNAIADEKAATKRKKAEIIVSIVIGVLAVCGIGVFIFFNSIQGTKEAKTVVGDFMNAAIHYEVDSMKSYLASDVNDKNGLMEAYTPDIMSKSFLSGLGITINDVEKEHRNLINEPAVLFGKNYIKKYEVVSSAKTGDGIYTVKVKASILDMSTTKEKLRKKAEERMSAFVKSKPDSVQMFYEYLGTDEAVANFIIGYYLFEDMCNDMKDAIKSAGSMETEFTFVVKNVDGNYKITEIDYKDE